MLDIEMVVQMLLDTDQEFVIQPVATDNQMHRQRRFRGAQRPYVQVMDGFHLIDIQQVALYAAAVDGPGTKSST